MEDATKNMINALKTMHLSNFDYEASGTLSAHNLRKNSDGIDYLKEAGKDAYNKFTSNVKLTMAHLERLSDEFGDGNFVLLVKELRFLRTSFRCLFKHSIHVADHFHYVTSTLMPCLAKVAHIFSYLAAALEEYVAGLPRGQVQLVNSDAADEIINGLGAFDLIKEVAGDVGVAYLDMIASYHVRYSELNIMVQESAVEYLDLVMENFHDLWKFFSKYYNLQEDGTKIIQTLTEDFSFFRSLLLFNLKEGRVDLNLDSLQEGKSLLICVEAVCDTAVFVSYFHWMKGRDPDTYSKLRGRQQLYHWIQSPKFELYTWICKASLFLLTAPLSDHDLLIGLLDLLFHYLSELKHNLFADVMNDGTSNYFAILDERLRPLKHFLVDSRPKHLFEPDMLRSLISETDVLVRWVGDQILSTGGKKDGVYDSLRLICESLDNIHLVEALTGKLETTPLSPKVLMRFLDFLYHNLIEVPKEEDYQGDNHLTSEVKDELEMLAHELGFLRNHFSMIQPKYCSTGNQEDQENSYHHLWLEVSAVAWKIGSMVCCHFDYVVDKGGILEAIMRLRLPDLLKSIRFMKASALQLIETPLNEELLAEFTDSVQHNLVEVLKDEAATGNGAGILKHQFEILSQTLGFQRQFLLIKQTNHQSEQEKWQGSLTRQIEAVLRKISSLIYSYYFSDEMKEDKATMLSLGLSELLTEIMLIGASIIQVEEAPLTDELLMGFVASLRYCVIDLTKDEWLDVLKAPVYDELVSLDKELVLLRHFLINYPPKSYPPYSKQERWFDIKLMIEVVVRKLASALHPIFDNEKSKQMTTGMDFRLPDLHEDFKLIKANLPEVIFVMDIFRISKRSPETDQLGFLKVLIENLRELMCCKTDLVMDLEKDQVQRIYEDVELLRFNLQYITENRMSNEESINVCECIRYAAYGTEHLIDSLIAGACPVRFKSLWISDNAEQMKLTKAVVAEFKAKKATDREIINDVDKGPNHLASQASLFPTSDLVVGFNDEIDLVKQGLASDRKELDLVSIVGMPGLGKTTLAKKVYEDPLIVDYFYVRAWCYVSQRYQKRELILTVLSSVLELTDLMHKMSDSELAVKLHKELMGRRYLIVLDDVWGIDTWEDLKRLFPDNHHGSRILLTSRNKLDGARYYSDAFELRFLTDEESWDLLQQRVFLKEQCPMELCEVGKQIARKCKGLPLAIVVVAGFLAKSHKERDFWIEVAGNLTSHMTSGDSLRHPMNILELSYKHLPDYLKPLFLYMGVFPEDMEIPTKKLIWLWIAEGFVCENELENLEIQAELSLKNLIDRSLVMPAKRGSNGRVKTCRIHDLIRDLCLAKAQEEKFSRPIQVYDELSDQLINYQWRLNICLEREFKDTPARPSIAFEPQVLQSSAPSPLKSLLFFNKADRRLALWTETIKIITCNSKSLKVLHSESNTFDEKFSPHLLKMVLLRYVSVRVMWNSIPSSVSGLWNLETLIVKGLRGEILVPDAIWKMVKLRHLHINDRANFKLGDGATQNSSKLEKLESFSTPELSYGEENKLLRRVPNVKRLRCIFLGMWNPFRKRNQLPELKLLEQLESLKVLYYGTVRLPCEFNLPSSLKKLSLTKFRLRWEDVSSFQELPNLEVLKLLFGAVDGEKWDMREVEFPKLKFLKLERLNIKRWNASNDNFPCLEKLILERCKHLQEIPSSLGDIDSLEKIEVLWCSKLAAKSAKEIQGEQEDLGNPLLKVHVYPPELDS